MWQICDDLAAVDPAPGEAHNYFALLDLLPQEVVVSLMSQRNLIPTLFKVSELMGLDPIIEFMKSVLQQTSGRPSGLSCKTLSCTSYSPHDSALAINCLNAIGTLHDSSFTDISCSM